VQLLQLLILGALMQAVRSFAPTLDIGSGPGGVVLGGGFLMLTAYLMGTLCKDIGLPKLTGYLITGVIAGPSMLGLVTDSMLVSLRIFNGVATALIALTAGSELEFRAVKPLLNTIRWIAFVALLGTIGLLTAAVFLAHDLLPFTKGLNGFQLAMLSLTLATTLAAQSPAVVVALRKEVEADGPLSKTVLTLVVVAEIVVVLLFALSSSVTLAAFGGGTEWTATAMHLAWEIPGSLVAGLLVGILIAAAMRLVKNEGALFIVTVGFLIAEIGDRIGFDVLLVALAAGLYVRNATPLGHRLHHDVEAGSLPVFVSFFSVAGAGLHLAALAGLIVPVVLFCVVRAGGYLAGARIGARIAGAPDAVRKYAGFGMLPQAGLALSLALLFVKQFPKFGDEAGALVFGVVTLNELICPVLYRIALLRSGEAGKATVEKAARDLGAAIPAEGGAG
jgi:Kef-type K+ transport system membrane component KefB